MKYATLFRNPSLADGFNINNIPWIGYEMEKLSSLACNEENKKIDIDEQGNASIVDNILQWFYTLSENATVYPSNDFEISMNFYFGNDDNGEFVKLKGIHENDKLKIYAVNSSESQLLVGSQYNSNWIDFGYNRQFLYITKLPSNSEELSLLNTIANNVNQKYKTYYGYYEEPIHYIWNDNTIDTGHSGGMTCYFDIDCEHSRVTCNLSYDSELDCWYGEQGYDESLDCEFIIDDAETITIEVTGD